MVLAPLACQRLREWSRTGQLRRRDASASDRGGTLRGSAIDLKDAGWRPSLREGRRTAMPRPSGRVVAIERCDR